jgi:hypothetical protein
MRSSEVPRAALLEQLQLSSAQADVSQFGDPRRTLIREQSRVTLTSRAIDEPLTVVVSAQGWMRAFKGHGLGSFTFAFKSGDSLYATFECRSTEALLVFTSAGLVHSVEVALLPAVIDNIAHWVVTLTQRGLLLVFDVAELKARANGGRGVTQAHCVGPQGLQTHGTARCATAQSAAKA